MAFSHYSFLNEGYNANVNNGWVSQGCIENIKRRLGYRLQLVAGRFRTEAQPGQAIPLMLQFTNTGYAAPFNPRGLELILRSAVTGQKFFAALSRDTDVRRWLPGMACVLNAQLSLPTNIPSGSYDVLLNLPDPAPTLYPVIPYAIRLANSNALPSAGAVLGSVWEPSTGYHRLWQTLTINDTATNTSPNGTEIPILDYSAVAENYAAWQSRNFPSHPDDGTPESNPDCDGRPNLVEYAVGSNPNQSSNSTCFNVSYATNALMLSVQGHPARRKSRTQIF